MSSICSKNDFDAVKAILGKAGVWDYFIFPSIDRSPKGPRIAALMEAVQLRPSTVFFLDNNPNNREEAKHFVPDIQVESEFFSVKLRKQPRGSDIMVFLRASEIRVEINFEVAAQLSRAVELINRTNQLNFTKVRLPEQPVEAMAALNELICRYEKQAGLVTGLQSLRQPFNINESCDNQYLDDICEAPPPEASDVTNL